MSLLEPLRQKRDKLYRELLDDTARQRQRKIIAALMTDPDAVLPFYDEFHSYKECPECHQPVTGGPEGWKSDKHKDLYDLCVELRKLEMQELLGLREAVVT